jgi:hypothetical protein
VFSRSPKASGPGRTESSGETTWQTLARNETKVARLRGAVEKLERPRDWRRAVGMFEGIETIKEIDELAASRNGSQTYPTAEGSQGEGCRFMIVLDTDHFSMLKYTSSRQYSPSRQTCSRQ